MEEASIIDHFTIKSKRAKNNAFLWSCFHNFTDISTMMMPLVFISMFTKTIPRSNMIIAGLCFAWPLYYALNANQRALWSQLDQIHYLYLAGSELEK